MKALRLWTIWVENPVTKERIRIIGQGFTSTEALNDAAKVINTPFRPKNDGKDRPSTVAVTLPDGRRVTRELREFDSETPWTSQPLSSPVEPAHP